jgi:outer membrane receptor protein involved in Fe transport
MKKLLFIAITFLFSTVLFAQTTVKGNVKDAKTGEPLPGVNIKIIGKALGTSTDFDGNFTLKTDQEPPFEIEISNLGYGKMAVAIKSNNQVVEVVLEENASMLDEVVVSASRTPESVRESPVTIERMDIRDIKNTASASFYNSIENLKGVDINTSSLTFNSVNTRGFAAFSNTRFVQLIDGMDNASPALNFVMGNLVGINELDVKSVELLPGASSALYGANAFNGILFMTSKNPFEDQGISAYVKKGITKSEAGGQDAYTDFGVRAAHAFSEKFAGKASFSYLDGTDWVANDTNMYVLTQPGKADAIIPKSVFPNSMYAHDGINIYGDEVATDIHDVAVTLENMAILPAGASNLIPSVTVGREGYLEQDITDYEAKSIKFDGALHFRPLENDLEIIGNYRVGLGNTIYQGANRYQLKNFIMQQARIEIRNKDFFVRAYRTSEDAGDSYDMRFTGINLAKIDASQWFGTYTGGYLQAVLGGATDQQAHAIARSAADAAYPLLQPGTPEFETAFDAITGNPDVSQGSKFIDKTSMNVAEGNYNFKSLLNDVLDLQIGGNYRQYSLNSGGTIFTDYDGPIKYNEYGAYIQATKKFVDDRLKLTASVRMDKNEFFDAALSPRFSINYAAGDKKQHNIRASVQTGFRNPTTQDLFIGFNVGRAILVGASPKNLDRDLPGTPLTGRDAYFDSYSFASVQAFSQSGNPADLVAVQTPLVEPEKVAAFDIGYRGKINKIAIDFNAYYNKYDKFMNQKLVITPISGSTNNMSGVIDLATGNFQVFQLYTNTSADINSYGAVIGLSTIIGNGYRLGANYTYSKLDFDQTSDPDFRAGFNTPEHKAKISFGNSKAFKNFGFNINGRWNSSYLWEASIANAVIEEKIVVDAQINYSMPKWKSTFKLGGTNLGGKDYRSAVGAGNIGSLFYVSWTINN